jgi:hypothetical protein
VSTFKSGMESKVYEGVDPCRFVGGGSRKEW